MNKSSVYQSEGYLTGLGGLSPSHCNEVQKDLLACAESLQELADPWTLKTHILIPSVYQAVTSKPVLDRVAEVLGEDLFLLSVDVFIKAPRSQKIVNWHQDGNYWGFDPFEITTAWIAVTDATPQNGCMQFAPQTHHDRLDHVETFGGNSALSRGQEIDMSFHRKGVIENVLKTGQFSLHHCLLAHYSGENKTDLPRIGLAARFMPTHIRQLNAPRSSVILVRGQDRSEGAFSYDRAPTNYWGPLERQAHAAALAPHRESAYSTV